MTPDQLKVLQAPIKARYREDPGSARLVLKSVAILEPATLSCRIEAGHGPTIRAGLHAAAGGDGTWACSAEMLLGALVGCAGVTMAVVATALSIPIRAGTITAEGDLDFRGTLGLGREVPVGFEAIRVHADLQGAFDAEQLARLLDRVERYCVVAQTLAVKPRFTGSVS
ncbi:MAG: OsmC family protein [Isosphaeraceae bacterium]